MMRESIGTTGVSDQALAAYFDGEATESEASAVRAAIEGDPELAAELEQLGVMKEITEASLQTAAAEVPQARFEQIWDQIDRAIEQGERLQESANSPAGLWGRLKAALAPVKWPMAAAAAAVAVTVFVMNTGDADSDASATIAEAPNKTQQAPSVPAPQDGAAKPSGPPTQPAPTPVTPDRIAVAPTPEAPAQPLAPVPEDSRTQLHEIDGVGSDVRISNGTVTVLYVEEDVQDEGSERSL